MCGGREYCVESVCIRECVSVDCMRVCGCVRACVSAGVRV